MMIREITQFYNDKRTIDVSMFLPIGHLYIVIVNECGESKLYLNGDLIGVLN